VPNPDVLLGLQDKKGKLLKNHLHVFCLAMIGCWAYTTGQAAKEPPLYFLSQIDWLAGL